MGGLVVWASAGVWPLDGPDGSAKALSFHFRQSGYVLSDVCLFVCLFVCLLSTFYETYWSDLHENFTKVVRASFNVSPGDENLSLGPVTEIFGPLGVCNYQLYVDLCTVSHFATVRRTPYVPQSRFRNRSVKAINLV